MNKKGFSIIEIEAEDGETQIISKTDIGSNKRLTRAAWREYIAAKYGQGIIIRYLK